MEGCGRVRPSHLPGPSAQLRMEGCGGEWFGVPVPRLFLFVGALHPIRRQCTSSVRVHRHVTGAPPRNGCSAPVLVAVVAAVGVVGVFWACVVFCLGHFVVPLWRLTLRFLRNVACNSPTRISNVEIAPLELQRFRALQKVRVPELHASFG